jgi:hypothetical protein
MVGKCSVCGQEVVVGRGQKLRVHLVNPRDPTGPSCPGRDPGPLPPRLPRYEPPAKRKPLRAKRKPRKAKPRSTSVRAILAGAFESNRRKH